MGLVTEIVELLKQNPNLTVEEIAQQLGYPIFIVRPAYNVAKTLVSSA